MGVSSTGRYFAEMVKGYGVTHVFYVPLILPAAMAEMGRLGITRVVTHHEVAAAYMADGYARAGRKPGLCMAQMVGAANMAAGLREPYLACSPVIAVTGGTHPSARYLHSYQAIEDFPMFEPVTKLNCRAESPARLPDLVRQAFREAASGSPGPVHLEMLGRYGEVAVGQCDLQVVVEEQFRRVPAYRPEPDSSCVEEAARLLAGAERPIIVAGGGVVTSGAQAGVVALAEKLSIPVVTSPTGKGTIPENHPLALGPIGRYGRPQISRLAKETDLVFFVGSRAGDMTTYGYTCPPPRTPAIQLDINPAEIGRVYPTKVPLVGDAAITLSRLIEAARPDPERKTAAWLSRARDALASWRRQVEPLFASDATPIRPERLCREISEHLPPGAVLVADTGHSSIWAGTMIELTKPGQQYIRCFGTLGWALPGSMGVKCALPDRPVLCFAGDAAVCYHMAELETAARLGINIVVVVNNNSGFGQTKSLLARHYGDQEWGEPREVHAFRAMDFASIAREMGCIGLRVEKPGEIGTALKTALSATRPVVVDVVTDIDAVPPA